MSAVMSTPTNNVPASAGPAAIRRVRPKPLFPIGVCLLALCLMVASCIGAAALETPGAALTRFSYTEYHMGVDARLVVYAPDQATAERACLAAFTRIAALDTIMSDYRRDSELMRLCARAGGPPVHVSPDLFRALSRAEEVSRQSNGAFDVTVGPVIQLWRQARKSGTLPDPEALERARKLVGWQKVRLDEHTRTVQLMVPGMKLDLGGSLLGRGG